jgi:hypothetical protein
MATDHERRLSEGDPAGADEAMKLLMQRREDAERERVRLNAPLPTRWTREPAGDVG